MQIPGFKSLEEVEQAFGVKIPDSEREKLQEVIEKHPMFIPDYYARLIDWSDPNDPIKNIIFPSLDELDVSGSYDTSGEKENTVLTGLQHKYKETALLLVTNRCAGYCRHCFRKRLVGIPTNETLKLFDRAVEYIKEHPEITNVLISGGDPLVLPTDVIEYFLSELSKIPHLKFIRFGSRVPVFYPMRIYEDTKLLEVFSKYSTPERRVYLVTHFNHPNEVTKEARKAVDSLIRAGVPVSNQTVLLKGVNDTPEVLATLMKEITSAGVIPYYVFQCRPVSRVKTHFQVPLKEGYWIVEGAKRMLDGHAKRFKYIMSHKTGKIEIVGVMGDEIFLKYHQAKNPENVGKFFRMKLTPNAGWLDDLEPVEEEVCAT
ncbi:KamA family radical SAM protein [Thermovibrio ammonificans]|jgi:KamA family protein|uniref:Lysine 2,3-aminomutase YodO family protein n=1 Tax=Thermovibrio ammonificans (strain DSM 15698 / JCM 12110 / HB-1) TaxID=648996 RepID=E8T685_THEA1|nr:KamA family radical SAM protein [Thermovibrio ammonificans]ADU96669.1 lysine 2,3-aminomutase YodO family protein [Thermovibrio ammonificans HB-1]